MATRVSPARAASTASERRRGRQDVAIRREAGIVAHQTVTPHEDGFARSLRAPLLRVMIAIDRVDRHLEDENPAALSPFFMTGVEMKLAGAIKRWVHRA